MSRMSQTSIAKALRKAAIARQAVVTAGVVEIAAVVEDVRVVVDAVAVEVDAAAAAVDVTAVVAMADTVATAEAGTNTLADWRFPIDD